LLLHQDCRKLALFASNIKHLPAQVRAILADSESKLHSFTNFRMSRTSINSAQEYQNPDFLQSLTLNHRFRNCICHYSIKAIKIIIYLYTNVPNRFLSLKRYTASKKMSFSVYKPGLCSKRFISDYGR